MKKIIENKISLIILLVFFFGGCQSLKDGLEGNKKSKSAEEFLIKKKSPLILPPEFTKLPTPGNVPSENLQETDFDIDKILGNKTEDQNNNKNTSKSSIENSILKKIKKN